MTIDAELTAQGFDVPNARGSLQSQIPKAAMMEKWKEPRTRTIRLKATFTNAFGRGKAGAGPCLSSKLGLLIGTY
jgi:hypothetical protein